MKRWLCVCEGGINRSVGLVLQLKVRHGQDAVPVGWRWNSQETLATLCAWADYVVVMQPEFVEKLPASCPREKVRIVDVGVDRYGSPWNSELVGHLAPIVDDWAKRGFEI